MYDKPCLPSHQQQLNKHESDKHACSAEGDRCCGPGRMSSTKAKPGGKAEMAAWCRHDACRMKVQKVCAGCMRVCNQ